jgi:hypothetical protein
MMTLFAVGAWVLIGDTVPAQVRQICISANEDVEYEVVWWDGRDRKMTWLSAFELKVDPDKETLLFDVGFHTLFTDTPKRKMDKEAILQAQHQETLNQQALRK